MLVATAKAAEAKVYWLNALAERRGIAPEGEQQLPRADYRARLRALAGGLFSNPLLTLAAQRALIPRRYSEPATVVALTRSKTNANAR